MSRTFCCFSCQLHFQTAHYYFRVDFYPQDDNTTLKKKLFRQAMQDEPCNYVFDGMQMFTVFTFGDNVSKVVEDEVARAFPL